MGLIVNGRMRFLGKFEGVFPQLPPPTPSFTASPTTGIVPLTVQFTNTTTATAVSYEWDFTGDGTVDSTDVNPLYTYNDIGNYSVSLTIVNTGGRITTTVTNYIIAYTLPPGTFSGPSSQTIPYVMRDEPGVTTFIGLQSTIVPYVISDSTDSNTFIGMTTPTVPYTMSNTSDSDTFIGFENTVPYVMQDYTN